MIGWIKKRCNRRKSDPMGGKLKEIGKGIKRIESDRPIYYTLENRTCESGCVEVNDDYEEVENVCPLCRQTRKCLPCSCLKSSLVRDCEEPVRDLTIPPSVHPKIKLERRYSTTIGYYRRPLPELPGEVIDQASSSEDECYGYESMGSDSGISADGGYDYQVYNEYERVLGECSSCNVQEDMSDDSDYEEIDSLPSSNLLDV